MAYTSNRNSVFYFKFSVEKIAWPILVKLILLAKVLLINSKGCIIGLEYGGLFRRISGDTLMRKRRKKTMEQLHCTTFNSINFRHFKWMSFLEHKYLLNEASDFKADFFFQILQIYFHNAHRKLPFHHVTYASNIQELMIRVHVFTVYKMHSTAIFSVRISLITVSRSDIAHAYLTPFHLREKTFKHHSMFPIECLYFSFCHFWSLWYIHLHDFHVSIAHSLSIFMWLLLFFWHFQSHTLCILVSKFCGKIFTQWKRMSDEIERKLVKLKYNTVP